MLQLCEDETNALCQRVFACFTASEQSAPGFIALYGQNQSDCAGLIGVKCVEVSDRTPCGGATQQTYNAQAAQQCLSATEAATCPQLHDPSFRPAGCDQACQ